MMANYASWNREKSSSENLQTRIAGAGLKRREASEGAFSPGKVPLSVKACGVSRYLPMYLSIYLSICIYIYI